MMQILTDLDMGILDRLQEQSEPLTVLLGDWRAGLRVEFACTGGRVVAEIGDLQARYGNRFSLRAFNRSMDLWWDGDAGVLCTDQDPGTARRLLLEPDQRRHPGMAQIAQALGNAPDLREYVIEAEEIAEGAGATYLRLKALGRIESRGEVRHESGVG